MKGFISGTTRSNLLDPGLTIRCMVLGTLFGLMERNMLDNSRTTSDMVKVNLHGEMDERTMVAG